MKDEVSTVASSPHLGLARGCWQLPHVDFAALRVHHDGNGVPLLRVQAPDALDYVPASRNSTPHQISISTPHYIISADQAGSSFWGGARRGQW